MTGDSPVLIMGNITTTNNNKNNNGISYIFLFFFSLRQNIIVTSSVSFPLSTVLRNPI